MADQQGVGGAWRRWLSRAPGTLAGTIRRPGAAIPGRREPVHPLAWRSTLQSRLLTVAAIFAVWTIGIEARLFYLQVVQHSDLKTRADRQQLDTIDVPAKRGEIVDRHGRVLAYSVDADTVFANPHQVRDPVRTAALVCGAIEGCGSAMRESMEKALRRRNTHFVYLARKLPPEQAGLIRDMNLEGVAFLKENRRYYPKGEIGAHVIGYVGTDNVGLAGLESAYDLHVRGKDGKVLVTTDARQHAVFSRVDRAATTGAGLELTIDQMLQYIAERELKAAVLESRAAGGSVVVMQPGTGEILALANYPTFDPNAFQKSDPAERRNRAIQDLYEPGSTFKLVTASAALEEDVIDAGDPVDCAPGFIKFEGRPPIRDVHTYGVLPFSDVIVKSSNVGAIKVGLKLGPERLSRYVSRFGFGQPIAPDFRGESPGIVWHPSRLDSSALASVSMGYQVGVTPVQMAAATSSIANGGTLVEPRIVRALIKDGRRTSVQPRAIRRTVSERTAAELTAIMEEVVERGTARRAQIAGFTVAGKTGTAAKLVDGRYSKSEYNASFVGFVPSRNPALTIIVVIDTPRRGGGNYYMGGVAAAPVFQRIAEASLRHLGVAPNINAPSPVLVARNDPDVPLTPTAGVVSERTVIERTEPGTMPDLRGLGAREAIRLLATLGMTARMSGNGFVVEHRPAAGTPLVRGDRAVLKLGRRMPAVPARSDR